MSDADEYLEFRPDEPDDVLARMDQVAADAGGWINFQPGIDPELEPPPSSSLFGMFSASGPAVPVCTWMPGKRRGDRRDPVSIGVQHGSGPRAVARLESFGISVPPEWRVRQDHPRRGLVVEVPVDVDHGATLSWLLEAGAALSTVPLTGSWRAAVFLPS